MTPGRNDPCPCGSGKKYKKCCEGRQAARAAGGAAAPSAHAQGMAPTVAEYNRLAMLFNGGHHAELERQAQVLLARCPEAGFVWKILGVALLLQGKDSLHAMSRAAALLPDDADAHYNLGNALMAQGAPGEAEASFRRALQIRPDDADVHYNLGNALHALGTKLARPGEPPPELAA